MVEIEIICFTYDDNNKIQAGPHTGEVFVETESDPLEEHLNCEEDGKNHVNNLKDELEFFIVLQVDIFKAQRKAEKIIFHLNILPVCPVGLTLKQRLEVVLSTRRRDCRRYHE